jgi:peptidoglycan/LPS O-acetylase OafA/YrhL
MREGSERLQAIEYVRGIAAFAVMWFHFTYRLPDGLLRTSGLYGYLGVQAFFVISGFIIPYAMDVRGFRIGRDGLAFVARRIVRLEPPYLMSIVLILAVQQLAALTPWFGNEVSAHDFYRAALHLFYLAPWVGEDWLSPVYWSLAIEFQYYFLVLAAAPLLLYRGSLWPQRALFLIVIGLACAGSETRLVFVYLPVFGFGFVQFLLKRRSMQLWEAAVWLIAFGAAVVRQDEPWWLGATIAIVALNMPWPKQCPPLLFLGTISYSLYLLHGPIGRGIHQVLSFVPDCPPTLELFVAIAAVLLLATAFWALVECPSTSLSQRIGRTMPQLSPDTHAQHIAA